MSFGYLCAFGYLCVTHGTPRCVHSQPNVPRLVLKGNPGANSPPLPHQSSSSSSSSSSHDRNSRAVRARAVPEEGGQDPWLKLHEQSFCIRRVIGWSEMLHPATSKLYYVNEVAQGGEGGVGGGGVERKAPLCGKTRAQKEEELLLTGIIALQLLPIQDYYD